MRAALLCALCLLAGCQADGPRVIERWRLVCQEAGRETYRSEAGDKWYPSNDAGGWHQGWGDQSYRQAMTESCRTERVPPQVERAP